MKLSTALTFKKIGTTFLLLSSEGKWGLLNGIDAKDPKRKRQRKEVKSPKGGKIGPGPGPEPDYPITNTKTKSSKNLYGKSAKKFSISTSASSSGFNPTPGECRLPFGSCGRGASCRSMYDPTDGSWYGNAICIPDGQCYPTNVWSTASEAHMRRYCCNGARFYNFWGYGVCN